MRRKLYGTKESQRGNAFIEFSLCFMLFMTLVVAMFEFSWLLFVKATFHHAVREGVRAAITGQQHTGYTDQFDNYIKSVIKANAIGILDDAALDSHVQVDFFNLDGTPLTNPAPGAIIQVSIQCYDVLPITSLIRPRDGNGNLQPITISVFSSDRMEPFAEGAPGRGTPAAATACPPSS
jgi:TadE-like protein